MKNPYSKLCLEDNCFRLVKEDDIARDKKGIILNRSRKCWSCRTKKDKVAIKRWRKKHNNIKL